MNKPFIITISLDDLSFNYFETLRKKFFPADKNFISAHLTLFHHLPPTEPSISEDLIRWSKKQFALTLQVNTIKNIGNGVAYKIESSELMQLHGVMQRQWQQWLTAQDKQKLWPHITIQNKVDPRQARETLALLEKDFKPFAAQGIGFDVWYYENGPWIFVEHFPFNS